MSLLGQFEHQYSTQTAVITSQIGRLQRLSSVSERIAAIRNIERLLVEVGDLLDQMELSVREMNSDGSDRSKYELRVDSYRNDKRQLLEELRKVEKSIESHWDRVELMSGSHDDQGLMISTDQQNRLIENTEKLEGCGRKIQDAYRTCIDSEQIGIDVLHDLGSQRETINRARERLLETSTDLHRSNVVLSTMIRRIIQNRVLFIIVGVFFFGAIFFILWMSY